ncbi:unnamed protein product [Colias eurytheme]|nr:unnamed protein product [Colias eurytheme]
MLSPRLFAFFALFAIAAALPAADKPTDPFSIPVPDEFDDAGDAPWFTFPKFPFMNFFSPIWNLFPSIADFGPKIEVDDKNFRVIVNVKNYKQDDLKVEVKGDYIFIHGSHEAKKDDHDLIASQFFYTYTLPSNASASDVTAKIYTDDILEISVPLNGQSEERVEKRVVPITEAGVAFNKDKEVATVGPVEDKKEPTTGADREPTTSPTLTNEAENSAANEVQP